MKISQLAPPLVSVPHAGLHSAWMASPSPARATNTDLVSTCAYGADTRQREVEWSQAVRMNIPSHVNSTGEGRMTGYQPLMVIANGLRLKAAPLSKAALITG